jgi:hypothetical protein
MRKKAEAKYRCGLCPNMARWTWADKAIRFKDNQWRGAKRKGPEATNNRAYPPQSPYSNPALVQSTAHLNPSILSRAMMGCCEVFSYREMGKPS